MATACGILEFDYVLRRDRHLADEMRTVFRLRTLSYAEMELLSSAEVISDQVMRVNPLFKARRILNYGLMGWERLVNRSGSPIECKVCQENGRRWIPDQILDYLLPDAIELANAITERSRLTEEQAKNF